MSSANPKEPAAVKIVYPVKEEKDLALRLRAREMQQPLRLARARPEFSRLRQDEVLRALGDADHPLSREVARLVELYMPMLQKPARDIRPAGLLRLDVRAPIEKVAADLAFRALRRIGEAAGRVSLH